MSLYVDNPAVGLLVSGTAGGAITGGGGDTIVKLTTTDLDTHSAYSSSTGLWTCPIAGYYTISFVTGQAAVSMSTGGRYSGSIYKNGSVTWRGSRANGTGASNVYTSVGTVTVKLAVNDTISFYGNTTDTSTFLTSVNDIWASIVRVHNI